MHDDKLEVRVEQAHITPFWHKLPFFFTFPFRIGPLVFMACLVLASALAGLVLGSFGLLFKGLLVYLGLRYGFNVLELFARGRFEGESPDHTLWGPEKRPAKLGLVILLFILVGGLLGDRLVDSRIARDPAVQSQILATAARDRDLTLPSPSAAKAAVEPVAPAAPAAAGADADNDTDDEPAGVATADTATGVAAAADPATGAANAAEAATRRAELLEAYRPEAFEPAWFRLLPAWYWLVMLLLSLMLPAATIVIALDDAFFRSLNPLNVLHYAGTMRGAYFVLWAFFLLIAGARHLVLTVGAGWPTVLRLPVELGLATYLGLVLCALLGYALYQFHQELRLDVEVDFDTHRRAGGAERIARTGSTHAALREAAGPQDKLERKLQPLLAEGRFAEAIAEVKDEMRYAKLDPELNDRLHAIHVQSGDHAATLAHGQQWVAALALADRGKAALAALRSLQQLDAGFVVAEGRALLPLAKAAIKQGEHALAVKLLQGFDKRFPDHADLPAVYFLGAQLMSEHARQHDKAAKLLRGVLARYPGHALAGEVQTYLAVLERLPQAPR
ncbi:tetratricopeptide repeat protein [Aquabacterium humicola]|uniref:tetratricopeptide repeat protein n=1 Tax=Aquabacterium humicola TaxID=3237377 RepID=UPI002543693A|nr:hypothetical protein [Rubrivivax pictus]